MTGRIYAFMKRDWYTCHDCLSLTFRGYEPYCKKNERAIHWNTKRFGCGEFATADYVSDPVWMRISGHASLRRIVR